MDQAIMKKIYSQKKDRIRVKVMLKFEYCDYEVPKIIDLN